MKLNIKITKGIRRVIDCALAPIYQLLTLLLTGQNDMAKGIEDIRAAHESLKTTLATEMEQINAKLQELRDLVPDDSEVEAVIADMEATTARISSIIPDAPVDGGEPEGGE